MRDIPGKFASLSEHRPPRPDAGPQAKLTINEGESPLAWLRARRGKDGAAMISEVQFLAGERLRNDFERSMLQRRITTNWGMATAGGNTAAEMSDAALAARERYMKALEAVGPELGSILTQVCCLSAGMEQAERLLNLPQRSGRAVLGLALTALARHYGLSNRGGSA
ncbi:DUF6456 domain-containing protein [Aestuariivirga sp.]|uniref:DUF6456 domain-containing protein n=1 Tax=Aestuariivirga sp. TaxID=2650926 RepID=UPI003BAC2817